MCHIFPFLDELGSGGVTPLPEAFVDSWALKRHLWPFVFLSVEIQFYLYTKSKNMKVVELKLKEDVTGEGITAISLVKHPAIEQNWIAFSEDGGQDLKPSKEFAFKTIDEDKRIIVGPAMIPDKMIFRKTPEGEEYFVFFTEDTVRELAERFLLHGKQNNMTLEHEATLNDLTVVESWIVEDSEKDKSAMYGFNLPVGSWFVTVKVLNDDIWNLVKANDVAGFSVEGVFTQELVKQSKTEIMSKEKKSKLDSYLEQIRGLFTTETVETTEETETQTEEFGSVEAEGPNGTITITFPGEALEVGAAITTLIDEAETPVPTGEYTLSDGTVLIVVEDGVVGELKPAEETDEEMETETDGLKAEQIDKLIDGIAEIISTFRKEIREELKTEFTAAVKAEADKIREEFNAEGESHKEENPDGDDTKRKIVRGLAKFVKEETEK
jgi:hypothetical protein